MDNLRTYQKNGDWKKMLEYYEFNKESIKKEQLNLILITIIETFNQFTKTDRKNIFKLISEIKRNKEDECTLNLLIRLSALFDSKETIIELLRFMDSKNIPIKKRTISPLIKYACKNLELTDYIYSLSTKNSVVLDDDDYIYLLKLYGEKEMQGEFNIIFMNMTKQLNIISNELANIILYYYSFRVAISSVNNDVCRKCNTSLIRDKLTSEEKQSTLKLIKENLANNNPKFLEYVEEIESNTSFFKRDYILDGANIGFYQQRPDKGGKLSYENINRIVKHLRSKNKSVILFLHEKHLNLKYISNYNQKIIKEWENCNILYKTQRGLNDDWYWLYLGIYLDNSHIISNDKMCDHYYNCFHEKSFKRWRDMTQVEFNFNTKVNLSNIKIAENGSLVNELKIHIPYYKNKNKNNNVEWLCLDNYTP